jgi:hypothetical protein
MKIGVTERFKIGGACCDRGCNVSKNISIPLIPDSPTSRDENFHDEIQLVSLACIRYHIYKLKIYIPFYANSPPETLTEGAFKE